jgi:phosphatidylserine synthase 2
MSRSYTSPQILMCNKLEKKDYNKFFYTPRTITTAIVFLLFINFMAYDGASKLKEWTKDYYADEKNPDVFENVRWPLFFAFTSLIAFAMTHFPDTMIKRPHPVFWRLFLGLLSGYSVFMTFVLILPLNEARYIFKIFHPTQGNPMPERSYAEDCRVFTPENPDSSMKNIKDAVYDVHFIAHLAGWWFKMMIIRDTKIAWIISGTFELIEISLRHWLPNFWECWWDHVSYHLSIICFSYSSTSSGATHLEFSSELGPSSMLVYRESTGCTRNLKKNHRKLVREVCC